MKRAINFFINAVAIFVAIVLTTTGGWASLLGVSICGVIGLTVLEFPTWWRMFYRTSMRILNYLGLS